MNKKGFTVVELLAVIIVLGVIMGITLTVSTGVFQNAKQKSEEVFISSLKDAVEIYLNNEGKKLSYDDGTCKIQKSYGLIEASKENIKFSDVIGSSMSPLVEAEFFNPIDKDLKCSLSAGITLYRDKDYVYYYKFSKSSLNCLTNYKNPDISDASMKESYVSTLPDGAVGC